LKWIPSTNRDRLVRIPFDPDDVADVRPPVAGGQMKTMASLEIAEIVVYEPRPDDEDDTADAGGIEDRLQTVPAL